MTSLLEASEMFQITVKKFYQAQHERADSQAMIKRLCPSSSESLQLWNAAVKKSLKSARKFIAAIAMWMLLMFPFLKWNSVCVF